MKKFSLSAEARAESVDSLKGLGLTELEANAVIRSQLATPSVAGRAANLSVKNADTDEPEILILDDIGPDWAGMVGAVTVARAQ